MPFRGLVHFDAFGAFCPDTLVHFGSGIQVQGGDGPVAPLKLPMTELGTAQPQLVL